MKKMAVQVPGSTSKCYGDVTAGPDGYLIVTWPDGTKQNSEVSNLAVVVAKEESVKKVLKRPAAAKQAAQKKSTGPDGEALSEQEQEQESLKKPRVLESSAEEQPLVPPSAEPERSAPAVYSEPLARNADKHPVLKLQSPVFGVCKTYRGPDKAYIQYWDEGGKRWVSVVNFTGQQVRFRHNECLMIVWGRLLTPRFGQAEVNHLKKYLLEYGPEGLDVD